LAAFLRRAKVGVQGIALRLADYFERTYVINLPERTDRRLAMERELRQFGMAFETGRVEIFRAIRPSDALSFPSVAILGCLLSHLEVLRQARNLGLSRVLVMEDDLVLSGQLRSQEDRLVQVLQESCWDMVHFAYFPYHAYALADYDHRTSAGAPVGLYEHKEPPLQGNYFYGVNGHVLDRLVSFLEQLLEKRLDDCTPYASHHKPALDGAYADTAFHMFRLENPDVVTLIACPSLGFQSNSRSDLSPKWFDRIRLATALLQPARVLKIRVRKLLT
jgi:glycosyl transferase family 25